MSLSEITLSGRRHFWGEHHIPHVVLWTVVFDVCSTVGLNQCIWNLPSCYYNINIHIVLVSDNMIVNNKIFPTPSMLFIFLFSFFLFTTPQLHCHLLMSQRCAFWVIPLSCRFKESVHKRLMKSTRGPSRTCQLHSGKAPSPSHTLTLGVSRLISSVSHELHCGTAVSINRTLNNRAASV